LQDNKYEGLYELLPKFHHASIVLLVSGRGGGKKGGRRKRFDRKGRTKFSRWYNYFGEV